MKKKIQELKERKNKIIIKIKKKELEKTNYIEKNNLEIKERLIDIKESSKEEKKQLYTEIIQRKKNIFDINSTYLSIIPIYDQSLFMSTLTVNYNPINEIDMSALNVTIGNEEKLEMEELE